MARTLGLVVLLLLMLNGCLQDSRAPELTALLKVAPELMRKSVGAELPPAQWPAELKALRPERVYSTKDGLHIVTSTFFVQEEGLFLPRASTFVAVAGGDPEFRLIVDGLYSYKLRG